MSMMSMKHRFLKSEKRRYVYGVELRECSCGVWRLYDEHLKERFPCYRSGKRSQTTTEALAQLDQSFRNLAHELHSALKTMKP